MLGLAGIVLWGPQNWFLRVMRDRKGISPPEMDTIVKRKKKEAVSFEMEQEPLFCNTTDENRPLDFLALDKTNMKHVAVPYSQLLYNPRFYDWPPEPEYARVLKEDLPSKSIVQASVTVADEETTHTATIDASALTKGRNKWQKVKGVVRLSPLRRKKKAM